jgi:hypothetical protein
MAIKSKHGRVIRIRPETNHRLIILAGKVQVDTADKITDDAIVRYLLDYHESAEDFRRQEKTAIAKE